MYARRLLIKSEGALHTCVSLLVSTILPHSEYAWPSSESAVIVSFLLGQLSFSQSLINFGQRGQVGLKNLYF